MKKNQDRANKEKMNVSVDNLNRIQAFKFAKVFNLTDLRMSDDGYWVANDGDCGEYRITADNYYCAVNSGDL